MISPAYGDKLYVLDTNVLSHDPAALFRFHEHAVFLPMAVLEALDEAKQGTSDLAQNVRQATRFLDDLLEYKDHAQIEFGIELPGPADGSPSGRLFFQTRGQTMSENGNDAGDAILASALEIKREHANTVVVLISKDINLRVKAKVMGLVAEDYYNDKVLDDVNLLYTGITTAGEAISSGLDTLKSWQQKERTFYRLPRAKQVDWMPGLCLRAPSNDETGLIVREITDSGIVVAAATDHGEAGQAVWGVHARNDEQNFALNLLLDPEYDFVSLLGTAGTGKTLLALAAGLTQTFEEKRYREIVMTRVTVSVGEDIGYLPGTEEEKMAPWMGALMDNLEVLGERSVGGDWGARRGSGSAAQPRQDPLRQLHARANIFESVHHHRRSTESHPQADKDTCHPRRSRHKGGVYWQRRTNRHAVLVGNDVRTHLRGRPIQELVAQRPRHVTTRRTFAARGLCGRIAIAAPALDGHRTLWLTSV